MINDKAKCLRGRDATKRKRQAEYQRAALAGRNVIFKERKLGGKAPLQQVCMVATGDIAAGEELFAMYGLHYWAQQHKYNKLTQILF
jgi:hypothetical protein